MSYEKIRNKSQLSVRPMLGDSTPSKAEMMMETPNHIPSKLDQSFSQKFRRKLNTVQEIGDTNF